MQNLMLGIALIGVATGMFFVAQPKEDGAVRPFLRADFAQGVYAVSIVVIGTVGAFMTAISLAGMVG